MEKRNRRTTQKREFLRGVHIEIGREKIAGEQEGIKGSAPGSMTTYFLVGLKQKTALQALKKRVIRRCEGGMI